MSRRALIAFWIVLGALLAVPAAHATFPGGNGFVVFQSNRDGDFDLFAQNTDGSSLRKLVNRPGTDEFNPGWNPAGTRLVFQSGPTDGSDFDLYLVNANGSGLTPLLTGATVDRAAQFCDADTIVFTRVLSATNSDVFAIETDGSGLRRLTDHPAGDSFPTCTPDGTQVAFISTRSGPPGIYVVPLASATAARSLQITEPTLLVPNAVDPDYSPDGKTLAYAGADADSTEIFTRNFATGATQQVSASSAPIQSRLPKFFPGGSGGLVWTKRTPVARAPAAFLGQVYDEVAISNRVCSTTGRPASQLGGLDFCLVLIVRASAAVIQPLPKCQCKNLTVGIPKKSVGSGQVSSGGASLTRLFFELEWDLTCSAGLGKTCKGQLELLPPRGFKINTMHRVTRKGKKVVLKPVADDRPVNCEGKCSLTADTTTGGTFRLAVNSPLTKAQLAGSRQTFKVETTCGGRKATTTIVIAFAASGKVKSVTVKQ